MRYRKQATLGGNAECHEAVFISRMIWIMASRSEPVTQSAGRFLE